MYFFSEVYRLRVPSVEIKCHSQSRNVTLSLIFKLQLIIINRLLYLDDDVTGANRYGLYSLFPGGGGGSYVAATPATPEQPMPARAYHATHKGKFTISFLTTSLSTKITREYLCSANALHDLHFTKRASIFVIHSLSFCWIQIVIKNYISKLTFND